MFESLNSKLFATGGTVNVGRFEVRDRLGAGGMGVVMSAFDPQLRRTVAVKVLRDEGDPSEHERLLDEARAMAKVRHPNLVTVYEAGTHDDAVFIAMEFVEGGTLRDWLKAQPRTWREVVAVFIGAARGLAAIHDAGMVHRDFKPDNVLLGDDGRAQVSDFGLARPQTSGMSGPELEVSEDGDPIATRTRGIAGTPNYLSPEQWRGERADAFSDQWSFFVALYEAVHGQRPFQGPTTPLLCAAVLQGERTALPASAPSVPVWLDKVIDRGLARKPADRHPSMAQVATLLEAGVEDRRGRTARAAAVAALTTAVVAGVAMTFAERTEPCSGVDASLPESWTDARKEELSDKFEAVGGGQTWTRIQPIIDARVEGWAAQRRDACEATHVRGEQSEDALDLRMRCLDRRAVEIESLLATYDGVDESTLPAAAQALDTLPSLDVCADLEFLRLSRPTPEAPEEREAVAALRERSERLNAAIRAGKVKESAEEVAAVLAEAEALGYEPLLAEVKAVAGKLASQLGESDRAATLYTEAFEHALATHHLEVQVWSAVVLVVVHGDLLRDPAEAKRWGRQAQALLRAHAYFPEAERALETNLGIAEFWAGEHEAAREHWETSLRMWSDAGLADSMDVISVEANLAVLARRDGALDDAKRRMLSALDKAERVLGPSHPMVARMGNNLALIYDELGQLDQAEALYRKSARQIEERLGADSSRIGNPLNNLGEVLVRKGQTEEALAIFDRVIALWTEKTPSSKLLADPLVNRAAVYIAQERYDDARADLERAQDLIEDRPDPNEHANLLILLARAVEPTEPAYAKRLASQAQALEVTNARVASRLEAWSKDHPP